VEENDGVALVKDVPQFGLRAGNLGTVINADDGIIMVEFPDNNGDTYAILTLDPSDLRSAAADEIDGAPPEALAPGTHVFIADMRGLTQAPEGVRLSHIADDGRARMVDVTDKDETLRVAVAQGRVVMQPATLRLLVAGEIAKGNVLTTAQVAGIMAAKHTHELIPMCHPLLLTGIEVELTPVEVVSAVEINAMVRTTGKTGVEMEALTAVTVAGLTVYDMCKAVDRGMRLEGVRLVSKSGGASGDFTAP
jgi:cyclic pyranopterin phosphate synthase